MTAISTQNIVNSKQELNIVKYDAFAGTDASTETVTGRGTPSALNRTRQWAGVEHTLISASLNQLVSSIILYKFIYLFLILNAFD